MSGYLTLTKVSFAILKSTPNCICYQNGFMFRWARSVSQFGLMLKKKAD